MRLWKASACIHIKLVQYDTQTEREDRGHGRGKRQKTNTKIYTLVYIYTQPRMTKRNVLHSFLQFLFLRTKSRVSFFKVYVINSLAV